MCNKAKRRPISRCYEKQNRGRRRKVKSLKVFDRSPAIKVPPDPGIASNSPGIIPGSAVKSMLLTTGIPRSGGVVIAGGPEIDPQSVDSQ